MDMLRFYNGKVLTMNHDTEIHEDYEVWIKDDKIYYVGPAAGCPKVSGDPAADADMDFDGVFQREIDLNGNLLMTGFKNAHTHSPMTFLRSYADDLPLQEWLYQQVFPMEDKLTPDLVYESVRLAVLEYLTSGITASFDMYAEPEANANANVDMGFRTVLCGTLNDFKDSIPALERFYQTYNHGHPLIQYRLGFHAEYTTSEPLLKDVAALADTYQAPVYAHVSETEQEVRQCRERHGADPVEYLSRLGIWKHGGGAFHCVHVTEADMELLKAQGVYVITNPASNAKLASGIAPIIALHEKGIPLAIGTDGPASNNGLDMFREMYLTTVLAKLREQDAAACPANIVLEMATVGGARAMGLTDCDCIAAGKQADLIVIDLHQPNMQPEHNIIKNLVYSGSKQNVKMTMIAGRILYEDGVFRTGEEPETIYKRLAALLKKIT